MWQARNAVLVLAVSFALFGSPRVEAEGRFQNALPVSVGIAHPSYNPIVGAQNAAGMIYTRGAGVFATARNDQTALSGMGWDASALYGNGKWAAAAGVGV